MKRTVVKPFIDKQTNKGYSRNDTFESNDSERIVSLINKGYLKETVKKTEYPKPTGGGWYELSNGEKIQGKDEAFSAQSKLDRGD